MGSAQGRIEEGWRPKTAGRVTGKESVCRGSSFAVSLLIDEYGHLARMASVQMGDCLLLHPP